MLNKKGQIEGTFNAGNQKVNLKLPLIEFEEDGSLIVYCPALDISGYGLNEEEANESFHISLSSFFQYTLNKKTFHQELIKLGWKVKSMHKPMIPPDMSFLLSKNDNFNRIFNTHPFRKFDKQIEIPLT